ncbi:beta-carotene 15,15'-monooxygenase [Halobacteriales archaeon QS_8_69_26]|nr:MAG: beta-carotene 15,15'-monooxygenase [Halobacteriales archaeon QS_8_69_26]
MATDDAPDYALGYESVGTEHSGVYLPVAGSFPGWLSGTFVRNGPGKFEAGGTAFEHWFDGLAMLRRFGFDDGVTYANRFLRTEAYREAAAGRVDAAGFAATPDRGPLDRIRDALSLSPTDNANADVVRIDGRYVALTESPRAVAFDPDTLATRGRFEWADDLPVGHTTPHLRRDREGGVWGYLTTFFPRAAYRLFRVPPGTRRREPVATVPVDEPAYMHSFGLTARYAVLVEQPYVVAPWRLLTPGDEPFVRRYEWKPQRRTRFLVVDRASGELAAEPRVPPFFTFHVVNAFEDGGDVVLDCVAWDTPSVLNGTFLDRLRSPGGSGGGGELRRYRVPLDGRSPEYEVLAEGVALPRCDGAREARRHRYVYAQDAAASGPPRGIVKVDAETGEERTWRDPDAYASEPVFVPRPDRADPPDPAAEDDGVLLVELLVPGEDRAAVAALDAETMEELGRAPTPDPIPFGFHGQFYRDGA